VTRETLAIRGYLELKEQTAKVYREDLVEMQILVPIHWKEMEYITRYNSSRTA
jgi:hypothetical protein